MSKLTKLSLAAVLGMSLAGSVLAADGLTVAGEVHGASGYQFRGQQFSQGEPSIGASLSATHTSGLYGEVKADTIKLTEGDGRRQLQGGLTLGYGHILPHGVTLSGGVTRNIFNGKDNVSDLSNSELFVGAHWNGAHAKVSTVVEGSKLDIPGFQRGDTFGEVGYTYAIGKYSVGGDVGYTWFNDNKGGVKDGLSLAQVRVGYAVNDQVDVTLTHQFAGDDAHGEASKGTHKTLLKVGYKF